MKKSFVLMLVFIFLFSSIAQARGPSEVPDFKMEKIERNGQTVYEYNQNSSLFSSLFGSDLDRVKQFFSKVAEALNAILVWDDANKTIQLIKPNVQMLTASVVGKDDRSGNLIILAPFGKVKKGDKLDRFYVYTEIDGLPAEEVEFRLVIERPDPSAKNNEKEFVVTPGTATNKEKDSFVTSRWINFEVSNANFTEVGNYKIKLQMRLVDSKKVRSTFNTIAEKTIRVTE